MNTKKVLISGIVGGIVFFLLGWLIYGVLLMDFMSKNSSSGVMKTQDEFVWWALIVSNLIFGILIAYVLNAVGNITSTGKGSATAATIGLLTSAGFDLGLYATSNVSTLPGLVADIAAITFMNAIVGAIIVIISKKIK